MGGREDPALMMDPANCLPVQVVGICQKSLPITACPDGSCMSAHKDRSGDVIHCSRAGLLIWLLACAPLSSWDVRGWIDVQLWNSQGFKVQQPLPDVHTSRARHRCSTPAWRSDEWHFDTHRTVFTTVARSLVLEFRTSRMFTTLNVGRRFSTGLSKPDNLLW